MNTRTYLHDLTITASLPNSPYAKCIFTTELPKDLEIEPLYIIKSKVSAGNRFRVCYLVGTADAFDKYQIPSDPTFAFDKEKIAFIKPEIRVRIFSLLGQFLTDTSKKEKGLLLMDYIVENYDNPK